jgi:hypothetical protein
MKDKQKTKETGKTHYKVAAASHAGTQPFGPRIPRPASLPKGDELRAFLLTKRMLLLLNSYFDILYFVALRRHCFFFGVRSYQLGESGLGSPSFQREDEENSRDVLEDCRTGRPRRQVSRSLVLFVRHPFLQFCISASETRFLAVYIFWPL